jgi:nucleoside-diphosphate-sugar epimerase
MPSKVFISGALGLIGTVLADRYRADGAEIADGPAVEVGDFFAHYSRMLGYEPKVSLDEGMRRTEEWLRAEGGLAA